MLGGAVALTWVLSLSGCITLPIPLPHRALPDSRTNVPSQVPASIAIGSTTRREVLLELGEPDGRGPNEEWYSYGSAMSRGGIGFFTISYGASYEARHSVELRRLLLHFDQAGIVSGASMETKRCPMWTSELLQHVSLPCMDILGAEVTPTKLGSAPPAGTPDGSSGSAPPAGGPEGSSGSATAAEPAAESPPLGVYKNVFPRQGDCPVRGHPKANTADAMANLQIFPDTIVFVVHPGPQSRFSAFVEHPGSSVTVPIAQIRAVEAIKGSWFWRWMNVQMRDGSCSSIQFGRWQDAQEATRLIRRQIEAQ